MLGTSSTDTSTVSYFFAPRSRNYGTFTPAYSVTNGIDIGGTPTEGARLNTVQPNPPLNERFGASARGDIGNIGTKTLRGPGFFNWDISTYKNFTFKEGRTIQYRPLQYARSPRRLQIAVRFDW